VKIIQIISSLGNGGAEKLLVELSNELAKTDEVIIISLKKVEDWMFHTKLIDNRVKLIETNKTKGFDLKVLYRLVFLLKELKPTVVHIHLSSTLYYFLPLIPFFRKINFYYTIHNTFGPHQKHFIVLCKLPFYKNVVNICLSKSIYDEFNKTFPKLRFTTIENGINALKPTKLNKYVKVKINIFKTKSNTKIFLFVGRLSYQKNIPLLLDVFSDTRLKDLILIIIGKGSPEITNQIKQKINNNKRKIVFLGPQENVVDYMQYVDALILTSRHEGLPIVVLEALSMGLPVLSTPVGALPDVIKNGINGFLSKSTDKNDIVDIIKRFSKLNKMELEEISRSNRILFNKEFSIKACAQKHTNLFKNEYRR